MNFKTIIFTLICVCLVLGIFLSLALIKIYDMSDAYNVGYNTCVDNCNIKMLELSGRCGGVNDYIGLSDIFFNDTSLDN